MKFMFQIKYCVLSFRYLRLIITLVTIWEDKLIHYQLHLYLFSAPEVKVINIRFFWLHLCARIQVLGAH